jgi:hypothetical protein
VPNVGHQLNQPWSMTNNSLHTHSKETKMFNFSKTLSLAAAFTLSAGLALAMAPVELTKENKAHITQMLTEMGYSVGKIKIEKGLYEAYAKKDGGKFEIMLDGDFNIVSGNDNDNS